MSRNVIVVTIDAAGRDHGKSFRLTEMDAARGEKWAIRAFLALARNGIEIPDDIANAGLAGIASIGIKIFGQMRFEDAEPLLDEMFACIAPIPDPTNLNLVTPMFPDSIEEIVTRLYLRKRIFGVHVDFSQVVGLLNSESATSATKKHAASPAT